MGCLVAISERRLIWRFQLNQEIRNSLGEEISVTTSVFMILVLKSEFHFPIHVII